MLRVRFVLVFCCVLLGAPASFLAAVPAGGAPLAAEDTARTPLPSNPTSVTVYPHSALVSVTEKLVPTSLPSGDSVLAIALPQQAYTGTFSVSVAGNGIAAVAWEEKELDEDAADGPNARRAVLRELESLRAEYDGLLGEKASAEARIAFWSKPGVTEFTKAEELEKVDAAMRKNIAVLSAALPQMQRRQQQLEQRIKTAQSKLAGLGAENRKLHQVTITLTTPAKTAQTLTYSYQLADCGWTPAYRFEALPAKAQLRFSQAALVRQNSGFDWTGVDLNVATVAPDARLVPRSLPGWSMQARDKEQAPAGVNRMMARESAVMADMQAPAPEAFAKPAPRPAPVRDEKTSFAVWKLGGRSLPTGETMRVPLIANSEWKTAYSYTLRPMRERFGFLTARPELPAPLELPRGEATFVVDETIISSVADYAFSGSDMTVFFGSDPLVAAEMRLTKRLGGEKGVISKDRTEQWTWEINVTNGRKVPVAVRVEDPIPVPDNEAVVVKVTSTPQPERDKTDYVWKSEIKPRGAFIITHSVDAKVPKDMVFRPGR